MKDLRTLLKELVSSLILNDVEASSAAVAELTGFCYANDLLTPEAKAKLDERIQANTPPEQLETDEPVEDTVQTVQ